MRSHISWLLTAGLVAGSLVGSVTDGSADPYARKRRDRANEDAQPHEAPPAPRSERASRKIGFVWIQGNWDWRDGRWEWVGGRYERLHVGRRFREPRWDKRGDVFVRVDGEWIDVGAPPALKEERFDPRSGFVFVRGHWDWDNNEWKWFPGRWERERHGKRWRDVRWEQRNGEWNQIDGDWEDDDAAPRPVSHGDYPTSAPPAPPNDRIPNLGPGEVLIPGHYEWRNNHYQWSGGGIDRARPGFRYQAGSWAQRGDRYVYTEGAWVNDYPSAAPPSPREERIAARNGYVFIRGHWDWRNGQWAWVDGRWESERAGQQWTDGRWDNRGGRWDWIEGSWGPGAAPCPEHPPLDNPPPPNRVDQREPLAGHIVIPGHWSWQGCKYVWEAAGYSQARPGYVYQEGRWFQNNGRWLRENGDFVKEPSRGYTGPTSAPPPPRDENYSRKEGHVWIRGHYDWRNGQYEWVGGRWERERPQRHWVDARWERRGNEWIFVEGSWE